MPDSVSCVAIPMLGTTVYVPTEYAEEAEHQDGDTYWDRFQTINHLMEDVQLYYQEKMRQVEPDWDMVRESREEAEAGL